MDTVGKLITAVLLCSVICLLLKKQAPELTLCLCMLLCVLCFLTSLPFFSPVLAFFHRFARKAYCLQDSWLLTKPTPTKPADLSALQQALAQAVEICCGFVSFYLALPLLELVLSLLQTMIGG